MSIVTELQVPTEQSIVEHAVDVCVQERLDNCSYRFAFNKVAWHYESGRLTLEGCVRSFYLKQVLQELLRSTQRVDHIVKNVEVICTVLGRTCYRFRRSLAGNLFGKDLHGVCY